jgi:hypothetical protein
VKNTPILSVSKKSENDVREAAGEALEKIKAKKS